MQADCLHKNILNGQHKNCLFNKFNFAECKLLFQSENSSNNIVTKFYNEIKTVSIPELEIIIKTQCH